MKKTLSVLTLLTLGVVWAADWPGWLGPERTGFSPETGLLTVWPATGPKVLWKVVGGDGYSSVAVAGGKAITLVQTDQEEQVLALDALKGTELWRVKIAGIYKNRYGNGPRSTPSIEGKRVWVQSVSGPLVCLDAEAGTIVWQVDLLKEFKVKNINWGLSASPLIHGDMVLAIPGAPGAAVAAFAKDSGKLLWKLGDDKAAYASPVAVTLQGKTQLIFFTAAGLLAVSTEGKELWREPWPTDFDCNICTPLVVGDKLFVSSGEKVGCALFQLPADGAAPKVAWESRGAKSVMLNCWANAVVHDGYLYGLSGEFSERIHLNCVELKSGKLLWSQKEFGKGAITLADGHLFITTKSGDLVLVRATPQKYDERTRITMLGENRTVPTLAGKKLYLRDRKNILCLDVAGK